jgi:hypothetical protein
VAPYETSLKYNNSVSENQNRSMLEEIQLLLGFWLKNLTILFALNLCLCKFNSAEKYRFQGKFAIFPHFKKIADFFRFFVAFLENLAHIGSSSCQGPRL